MTGDEQTTTDERLREEQTTTDERLREEQTPIDELTSTAIVTADAALPRVSRRQALVRVVAGLVVAGVVVGALWAWLAPSVQGVVALARDGDRIRGYVGEEADHLFFAAFLMVGMLSVLAVVSAASAWKWRAHRGPAMVGALSVGLMLAAGAATGVGTALAHLRYGTVDVAGAPISPEHRVHYVFEAPGVFFGHTAWQLAATIVFPAGIAALIYAVCALAATRDDLGAWPTDPAPTMGVVPHDDLSVPLR